MLEPIRRLRNRAFHHEPIWHRSDLHQRYDDILTIIGWANPAMRDTLTMLVDHFPQTYAHGYKPYEQRPAQLITARGGTP